ncbi:hypothetical protein [Microbacterium sp. CPCC 204701]|uniref:hypothetical protein n=1 Tax=Microbacterium sp. CPCC 204701 TaxID=2493084 RepID=UPI000FDA5EA3|nr:hypothetical protein [Microbacterium sp. CPCC 204701]
MSSTSDLAQPGAGAPPKSGRTRFAAWPLWAVVAGIAGTVGTVATDLRPAGEIEAVANGEAYAVTSADMIGLDPLLGRIGFTAGLVAILCLIVFAAAWRRHADARFTRSTAARVVSGGLIAATGVITLGYGWRGALANYLGPEAGMYDEEGLFVYYMLTDFGAYIGWTGLVASALALAWMAFRERSVSRILGGFSGLFGILTLGAIVVSGVPGLPGVFMPVWLAVTGLWLAVGRSRVTEPDPAR